MEREIVLRSNSDFSIGVRWKDQDGNPYALDSGALQVRLEPTDPQPLLTATVTIEADVARADISKEDIALALGEFTSLNGYYDFVVVRDADGFTKALLTGSAALLLGITQ